MELQLRRYSEGLPVELSAPHRPLPFLYLGKKARRLTQSFEEFLAANKEETHVHPPTRPRSAANLPEPHILAEEIAEDLRDALGQIESVLADLRTRVR